MAETAEIPPPVGAGFRTRISERVFRAQVREGLTTELNKRAKKAGAAFGAAAVPHMVTAVPDDEIDRCRRRSSRRPRAGRRWSAGRSSTGSKTPPTGRPSSG